MGNLEGKIKSTIFYNEANGYVVALFRVSKADEKYQKFLKKVITITGNIIDLKLETPMIITGEVTYHEKFGEQFKFSSYEILLPTTTDDIIDFLTSSFVKGCGKKTALNIVSIYGEKCLDIIRDNKFALDKVEGMTEKKRDKIYDSLMNYAKSSDIILKIKNLGFSIEEAGKIYSKFKGNIIDILNNNIYLLTPVIEFRRIDGIFLNNDNDRYDKRRVKACILEVMKTLSSNNGDIYYSKEDIYSGLLKLFNLEVDSETFLEYLKELKEEMFIAIENAKYYLIDYYNAEIDIAHNLKKISLKEEKRFDYSDMIKKIENKLHITYNDDQKRAINTALNNNITIISGGPGTGKTTIINAIVRLYIEKNHLRDLDIVEQIALLAPTGRAAKKMSTATGLSSSTIHRFLKWNKEADAFGVNENNKNIQKLIIVDEVSMIDTLLFSSLLKGLYSDIKLILVGDAFQLPSVGPGLILNDLIASELFNYVPLNYIYRQSDNSYIPYLAREIKNKDLSEEFTIKRDDYNFIITENRNILGTIKKIIEAGITKGYDENNIQVLAPMYRGENGIDNLNRMLCEIFNPDTGLNKIMYGDVVYKVGDKVLQLVNDADNFVFNGDIGYIRKIYKTTDTYPKEMVTIDFDGNVITIPKKDLKNIRHAYAITIHKSQGSEFDHVIMPMTFNYGSMLYNKILYTGVSRAKKSLIIVGSAEAFYKGIFNDYGWERKTNLKEKLNKTFNT